MSKGFALLLVLVFLIALCVTSVKPAKARLTTIIVPDDYPTITAAIGNATNGDTVLVRSGTYNEQTLETNKTISLIGEGLTSTIVNLHPPSLPDYILGQLVGNLATAIEFNANNIVVSGFTINSYGAMGITGNDEVITGNAINEYAEYSFTVTGNYETIYNNTSNNYIHACCTHSTICSNSGTGTITVEGFYSSNSFFEGSFNSVFDNNMKGVGDVESSYNLYYSNIVNDGYGMDVSLNDILANNTITNCNQGVSTGSNDMIVGNTVMSNSGAGLSTTGLNNIFWANYVANNAIGILTVSSSEYHGGNFTIYDNDFINNTDQTQVTDSQGGPWSDYWNSSQQGNYWSDYLSRYPNATQVGSLGIWNTPYYVGGGEQDNYPLMNPFDISTINIQLPSWANITVPNLLPTPSFPPSTLASQTPTSTTVPATTDNGSTVNLAISGNITSSQMSNVAITTNKSAATTTVSFTVTGESGTTGFSNMTIPKSAVPYGTKPTIYIDGQTAQDQGYTQDINNYYVWYTTSFSTHQISIVFTTTPSPSPSPTLSSTQKPFPTAPVAAASGTSAVVVVGAGLFVYFKKRKQVKLHGHE